MAITYDAIIIGSEQAGPPLAVRLAGAGMRVAIIERERSGGTCVNPCCIPTKTLVGNARAAHIARRAADFLAGLMEKHEKMAWMLRAFSAGNSVSTVTVKKGETMGV